MKQKYINQCQHLQRVSSNRELALAGPRPVMGFTCSRCQQQQQASKAPAMQQKGDITQCTHLQKGQMLPDSRELESL
jgi:hypothetical protein